MSTNPRIGVFAPSSPVPMIELGMGVDYLRARGFAVHVHEQTGAVDFIHAGTDEQRAGALWELANDPAIDVLWCARGGYGANKLPAILDELTRRHGAPPPKLLVGFSDVTILHHYTRTAWGWHALHAAMPAQLAFSKLKPEQINATLTLVRKQHPGDLFGGTHMTFDGHAPDAPITGQVLGGNLATWNYLTGTPHQPHGLDATMLFFEDLGEGFYKMDAYLTQLAQSGGLDGVKAIILGGFHGCSDSPGRCLDGPITDEQLTQALEPGPDGLPRRALRESYEEREAMAHILAPLQERFGFAVCHKLPVTHGPADYAPLPLGATYTLGTDGSLTLDAWDWLAG
ncbi:LD-carboxypeptidase [Phycisphaeraceae bacterium D3-23]